MSKVKLNFAGGAGAGGGAEHAEAKIPKRPQSANAAKRKSRAVSAGKVKPVAQGPVKEKMTQLSA